MISRIGPIELVLILVIVLIIFGPKKLPQIGKALGNAIREFKGQSKELKKEFDVSVSLEDEENENEDEENENEEKEPKTKA